MPKLALYHSRHAAPTKWTVLKEYNAGTPEATADLGVPEDIDVPGELKKKDRAVIKGVPWSDFPKHGHCTYFEEPKADAPKADAPKADALKSDPAKPK